MIPNQCVDEITIEGDSSKLIDAMEAKRKAEFDPDPEEEEESNDEKAKIGEPEGEIDCLKAPEWDVDSFDGLEYYSSSLDISSDDDERTLSDEEAMRDYHIFKRQIIESKGFYADRKLRPSYNYKQIFPVSLGKQALEGKTYGEFWEDMVHVCLHKLNKDKDLNVEFVEVVRGHYRVGPRSKSYITFMAREKPVGPLVEYQAKGMLTFDKKKHPILCRPTPMPKP